MNTGNGYRAKEELEDEKEDLVLICVSLMTEPGGRTGGHRSLRGKQRSIDCCKVRTAKQKPKNHTF
jgi:hypothetical protein